MKKYSLFIKLITLDFVSKIIAHVVAPQNDIFFLTYNKDVFFNLDMGPFVKFALPLMILPVFLLMGTYLDKAQKNTYFQIVMAGFLGNYVCRFMDIGVVDFIHIGYAVINFADIFCYSGYLFFAVCVAQNLGIIKKYEKAK
jgi:lipoprotein signal peptidase